MRSVQALAGRSLLTMRMPQLIPLSIANGTSRSRSRQDDARRCRVAALEVHVRHGHDRVGEARGRAPARPIRRGRRAPGMISGLTNRCTGTRRRPVAGRMAGASSAGVAAVAGAWRSFMDVVLVGEGGGSGPRFHSGSAPARRAPPARRLACGRCRVRSTASVPAAPAAWRHGAPASAGWATPTSRVGREPLVVVHLARQGVEGEQQSPCSGRRRAAARSRGG